MWWAFWGGRGEAHATLRDGGADLQHVEIVPYFEKLVGDGEMETACSIHLKCGVERGRVKARAISRAFLNPHSPFEPQKGSSNPRNPRTPVAPTPASTRQYRSCHTYNSVGASGVPCITQ